jgi:phosphonate transport system substrate-binding protein
MQPSRSRHGRWLVPLCGLTLLHPVGSADEAGPVSYRFGISSSMFSDVNENDARAAVKVWGQTVARERKIEADPEPLIVKDHREMLAALRTNRINAITLTTVDYFVASREVRFDRVFVSCTGGKFTQQYVVVTHRDSGIGRLADLKDRSLIFFQNPRACLAEPWLDTVLAEQGLPLAARLAGPVTRSTKLAGVVLPVFFRRADACVVTQQGLALMQELNPQVGRQLRIIATSPELVTAVLAFRAGYNPPFREALFAALHNLHETPAGQQVLVLFQSTKVESFPASCLDPALEILARHARLGGTPPAPEAPP